MTVSSTAQVARAAELVAAGFRRFGGQVQPCKQPPQIPLQDIDSAHSMEPSWWRSWWWCCWPLRLAD